MFKLFKKRKTAKEVVDEERDQLRKELRVESLKTLYWRYIW